MKPASPIPETLRAARLRAKLSARELGRLADINEQLVSMIERGDRPNPESLTLLALSRVLGVPVGYFYREVPLPSDAVMTAAVAQARATYAARQSDDRPSMTGTEG